MPEMTPPAATMSRLLREVSAEVIAWVNAHSSLATRLMPSTAAAEIEGDGRGVSRTTNKCRANPKVDAAMAVLLPGGPTPNRLRREAHFVQCNVIVCI
jgi:hypothetical protein